MRDIERIGFGLGVVVLSVFLLLPPIEPLTALGMKTLGIFLSTIIWWVTTGLGYPSLLCIALLALTGVMPPDKVFAASMGHWAILFLIGIFGISECLRATGVIHRFAMWFITRSFVAGRPWMLVAMLLLACALVGSVMSITATCVIFMSVAAPLLEALGYKKGDRFASAIMMGIAWASTSSSGMTPIGFVGNLMMIEWIRRDFGHTISFPQWMIFGIPTGLLAYLMILGVLRYVVRPDVSKITSTTTEYVREMGGRVGPMKLEEKLAIGVFAMVAVFWMLPGVAGGILPEVSAYLDKMGYAIPPLVGACLLCIIRVKNQPLMTFQQWMKSVDWTVTPMAASIMVLGVALENPEAGILELMTRTFKPLAVGAPFYVFILITLLWVILQTNLMSSMISMTLVYTIMVPASAAAGVGSPAALGATIAAASNYAFSLPSGTFPVALVTGSGWVPIGFTARYGIVMIVPAVLAFTFIFYPLASLILG